jgi:hypothetical protein
VTAAAHMEVSVGLHAVAEAIGDETLTRAYGSGSLGGELEARVRVLPFLEAGLSAGYRRLGGETLTDGVTSGEGSWLWYAPLAVTIGPRVSFGAFTAAASLGPTAIVWAEKPGTDPTAGYEGGKWGVLGQAEARLDPRVFTRVMHDRGPADFFLVARAGGRATLRTVSSCEVEAPCGLNFGALRLSLGATMVLP